MFAAGQSLLTSPHVRSLQRWATWGSTGVQNVSRSAWVNTDAASKTANATSVETRLLAASVFPHALRAGNVRFYPHAARYILYPLYPPRCPPLRSLTCKKTNCSLSDPNKVNKLYPIMGRDYVVLYWEVENMADNFVRYRLRLHSFVRRVNF